ncbi:tumor necrosis factor receptor superfamily member 5 isoform X2 [Dunckerocampus dactyliophorus]|uniref:tumor necrosis factor receptor superfamily member 5 isoform X2 n=1 Tax=Dunckerocampus dactyliophorus TaxID=161453 RepID=UPI002407554E|nr:tumor necrosis factor receptor superfamily member 5 isoform X2 [Dunckerocampus dactyliophorus]
MAECTAEDKYLSKGGRCCDRCPPGSFVQADCDDAKKTQCGACGRGLYTATRNHLSSCIVCRQCSASNNQRTAKECTAHKDTVCGCLTGFFCSRNPCEHCMPATICFPGSGVKVQTTGANDTVCAPCEKGTYSNVSDSQSACQMHTRCEDLGRELKTPGTSTTDAICGDLKSARSSIPVHEVKTASAIIDSLLEPQLPNPAPYDLCQKSDTTAACQFTIFNPDDSPVSDSTEDNMGLPASLKTDSSDHRNGTDVYHRSYSEPQEDEWCGT